MNIDRLAAGNGGSVSEIIGQKGTTVREAPNSNNVEAVKMESHELMFQNEEKRLKESVEYANKALEGSGRHFKYEVHEQTKQVVISVMDDRTNEVITEIPSRKLLDIVGRLMELAGLIVDERR